MSGNSRKSRVPSQRQRVLHYQVDRFFTSAGSLFALMVAIFLVGVGFSELVNLAMSLAI